MAVLFCRFITRSLCDQNCSHLGVQLQKKYLSYLAAPVPGLTATLNFLKYISINFFAWLCAFSTNKTFFVFDHFISAWPLLWLAPQCTILYCLAHYHCIEICQYHFFSNGARQSYGFLTKKYILPLTILYPPGHY